jgi:hypothetical protein
VSSLPVTPMMPHMGYEATCTAGRDHASRAGCDHARRAGRDHARW